ncbi:MAG TPA: response regulator transcription factor [Caulobacteraceae bacterium]|jgi:DNA-binding NarL/FixJ family response regulator|nr:response regulator transcription factor [Caulobacteraceae bacterium]
MSEAGGARSVRILIADDHPIVREGLAMVLQSSSEMEVVGEAGDGAEAVRLFRDLKPDITLMDLQMPVMNGVDAIAAIRGDFPKARIIVLTTYAGDAQAMRALKAGAVGYLLKNSVRKELLDAIRAVHSGLRYLQADVSAEIAHHAVDEPLTARETDILRLVAAGKGNKAIANQLAVSEDTVKGHLKSAFAKLDVADRTHAVTVAAKRGIIEL